MGPPVSKQLLCARAAVHLAAATAPAPLLRALLVPRGRDARRQPARPVRHCLELASEVLRAPARAVSEGHAKWVRVSAAASPPGPEPILQGCSGVLEPGQQCDVQLWCDFVSLKLG